MSENETAAGNTAAQDSIAPVPTTIQDQTLYARMDLWVRAFEAHLKVDVHSAISKAEEAVKAFEAHFHK